MLTVERITTEADLGRLAAEINAATWDEANDLVPFDPTDLAVYLAEPDNLLVACHDAEGSDRPLLGFASARLCTKPYGRTRWLYVDEVDVVADGRRRGAGRALMDDLLEVARRAGCDEVWLGTEPDNVAANALYGSLAPTAREPFIGYTWDLTDDVAVRP